MTTFGEYCIGDTQCDPGKQCIPDLGGLLRCQQIPEQMSTALTPKQIICQNDPQCNDVFGKCTGWPISCQYKSLEWKIPGSVNDQCYNEADCAQYLHCINRNGMMTCQIIPGMLPYTTCRSDADCGILQTCSFSKQYNTNLCFASPEYRTVTTVPFWSNNVGSGVISRSLIDNGAIPKGFEKQCTADYQCTVFEICAERNFPGKRICIYNPTTSNRQCRFNADCQPGQRCEKVLENLYLCSAAKQTTFMQPCNYDYECSGGQRCINISNDVAFQQNFRYCLSFNERLRCQDDMDCTDAKTCRVFGKFKQCVPVISSPHLTS
ncbi:hypothetical protein LOAG_07778 [Loa loa]|uniref:Uncharacterized protein n=1 Tax=Loa loa TaxID=7209 RepID=A0A1S0TUX7_LOALO|nr:hypothetical protein LOAG_07778 [Loa loa]EFO20711.1 hypothetical protein LOAG_07778 [Loa loa]